MEERIGILKALQAKQAFCLEADFMEATENETFHQKRLSTVENTIFAKERLQMKTMFASVG